MEQLFWGCFAFGILLSIVSVLLGDVISQAMDGVLDFLSVDFFQPMVMAGAVTIFGGAGILLLEYSPFGAIGAAIAALLLAAISGWLILAFYVRPMKRSERSTGFAMAELAGRICEVIVPIPVSGFGEVLIRTGAGHTNQVAVSFENVAIQAGEQVVIVEVNDGAVYVSRFENTSEGV
ncbi:MAG: protease [Paenibacillaceae bacterium]|nr:protease [Paenibacillaceae bacterium]